MIKLYNFDELKPEDRLGPERACAQGWISKCIEPVA